MTNAATVTQFQSRVGKSIENFLEDKGKRSKDTEKAYRGDITLFLDKVFNKTINTITAEELELLDYDLLREYLHGLYEVKSNSAINRYASSIKSMYRDLNIKKIITTDLKMFELIKALPSNPNSYEAIPMDVALDYIDAIRFEKYNKEEKTLAVKMAIELGLRESELRDLEWKWFKVDGDVVHVSGVGKGKKRYREKISLDLYNQLLEIKGDSEKVFTISKKNLVDMMGRLKKQLGHEDRNYTFHSFKKTAVTNTYKYTGSITDAQAKGKHTYLATTQLYLEEEETKMTGYFSLEGKINHDLYKEVSHDKLVQALQSVNKELLFALNLKLQE